MHGMTCDAVQQVAGNPPAPQSVACPPGMSGGLTMTIEQQPGKAYCTSRHSVVECPLAPGEAPRLPLSNLWLVEKDGPLCHAEDVSNCPPGADCNPPRPRMFPCPPGVTEDHPLTLAEMPDATCVRVPNGCLDTGCARERVACLPADAKSVGE